jgi:hypothetical protein
MATSQNGWPVIGRPMVVDRPVVGVEFPNGWRIGDVDAIFTYLIERLHAEVEPIDDGGCWGWFVKTIEGSKTVSNHASGTAIDYNAPAHPMGVRNTYSKARQRKIRAILADLDGVVRWGGDYTGRPDDMHFEINRGAAAVRAVATKIRAGELPMALTEADKKWLADQIDAAATKAAQRVWSTPITDYADDEPRRQLTAATWVGYSDHRHRTTETRVIEAVKAADQPA